MISFGKRNVPTLFKQTKFLSSFTSKTKPDTGSSASTKIHFNVGTIGHVDHGKTTLTSAITKVLSLSRGAKFRRYEDIDNAPEERSRGVTINASRIGYETKTRHFAHIDCPGHSDYIKNMITGTSQMDAAILVIAADDGVMAQTKEHLLLAKNLGVKDIVVFINKVDLVDSQDVELVEMEALELLTKYGFNANERTFVKGSALDALENDRFDSINQLMDTMESFEAPPRKRDGAFLMPITSVQSIKGRGTVVIGTIESGIVKKGDTLEICGYGYRMNVNVSDIHVFSKSYKELAAGDHCGILCKGEIRPDTIRRGMWLTTPGTVFTTNMFKAKIYMLEGNESGRENGIRPGFSCHTFCSTWDVSARLYFENDLIMPGDHSDAWIFLIHEVPIRRHASFTLREGRQRTIARGIITNIFTPLILDSFKAFRKFDDAKMIKNAIEIS